MKLIVNDGMIDELELVVPCSWWLRYDVFPFFFVYLIGFALSYSGDENMKAIGLIIIPIGLVFHVVLFLFAQGSVSLRCKLGHKKVNDISNSKAVLVKASKNAGNDRIIPLTMPPSGFQLNDGRTIKTSGSFEVNSNSYTVEGYNFQFQKVVYSFDQNKKTFVRLSYPTTASVSSYLSCKGHMTTENVLKSWLKWGSNEFDIPIPGFLDLYAEHLMAPFFVFQVLCLLLWSLDDYWYYSFFTLMMLMFFEGMLCRQRQNSVMMLRTMRKRPYEMFVHREGKWSKQSSQSLVPGDVISLTVADQSHKKSIQQRMSDDDDDDYTNDSDDKVVPCDALIIKGSCVVNEAMLTGESVPQLKESLRNGDNIDTDIVDIGLENNIDATWRRHLVFGGTAILQHTETLSSDANASLPLPPPPDHGCIAVVARTGFGTSQGGLMRKILFATERVTANSMETFYFIAILVVFAIGASAVVLHGGLKDESRNKFRLVLHCIMIITSVIPPELPMELSLAVTNSLAGLSHLLVFCTEPFRIPLAGKLNVLCFDKTGTLTKDKMILKGVVGAQDLTIDSIAVNNEASAAAISDIVDANTCSDIVVSIMAGCHSLMKAKTGTVMGDPMELVSLEASGFSLGGVDGTVAMSIERKVQLKIKHRYPFSSALKRMSVVVESKNSNNNEDKTYLFTKGAPEIIANLIDNLPLHYKSTYLFHMNKGKRVLTIAYKEINIDTSNTTRVALETGLKFAGFLIFDCDLKVDSKSVIRDLKGSNHKVIMITGDSAYTAADVAKKLGMLKKDDKGKHDRPIRILETSAQTDASNSKSLGLVWTSTDSEKDIPYDDASFATLASKSNLCITGSALKVLQDHKSILMNICLDVVIFARVSPAQKEDIILALNDRGAYTLMCGDGTNDVGALKAAHVGVSIVNDPEFESRIESAKDPNGAPLKKGEKKKKGQSSKDRLARAMAELHEQEQDPTVVKLGDASIASPFTARRTSIDSVLSVIRQGRCTLVTSIQVFKILALNCLVSAYMMSALYLRGLKQGDMQMTAAGIITAALFYFLSQAKPLPAISALQPPSSVFALSVMSSVAGQFIVHLISLMITLKLCEQYMDSNEDPSLSADTKFQPNVINSAVYVLTVTMQVNNFVINYRGHPFTKSIQVH